MFRAASASSTPEPPSPLLRDRYGHGVDGFYEDRFLGLGDELRLDGVMREDEGEGPAELDPATPDSSSVETPPGVRRVGLVSSPAISPFFLDGAGSLSPVRPARLFDGSVRTMGDSFVDWDAVSRFFPPAELGEDLVTTQTAYEAARVVLSSMAAFLQATMCDMIGMLASTDHVGFCFGVGPWSSHHSRVAEPPSGDGSSTSAFSAKLFEYTNWTVLFYQDNILLVSTLAAMEELHANFYDGSLSCSLFYGPVSGCYLPGGRDLLHGTDVGPGVRASLARLSRLGSELLASHVFPPSHPVHAVASRLEDYFQSLLEYVESQEAEGEEMPPAAAAAAAAGEPPMVSAHPVKLARSGGSSSSSSSSSSCGCENGERCVSCEDAAAAERENAADVGNQTMTSDADIGEVAHAIAGFSAGVW